MKIKVFSGTKNFKERFGCLHKVFFSAPKEAPKSLFVPVFILNLTHLRANFPIIYKV